MLQCETCKSYFAQDLKAFYAGQKHRMKWLARVHKIHAARHEDTEKAKDVRNRNAR